LPPPLDPSQHARRERLESLLLAWIVEKRWKRWIWILVAVALTLYILFLLREIILPLAIAFLIAMVLDPIVDRLEQRGWSRLKGTIFIYAVFAGALAAAIFFLGPVVVQQAQALGTKIDQLLPDRSQEGVERTLRQTDLPPMVQEALARAADQISVAVSRSGQWIAEHAIEIFANLIWVIVIPIVAFYALKDFHLILAKGLLLVPRDRRDFVQTLVADISLIMAKYIRALAFLSFLNGLATFVLLLLLGVPNALMLGVIAMILYAVPYIGAIITVALITAVAFVTGGMQFAAIVFILIMLVQQILFDYIITPRLLGDRVGLHPILAIIALLSGNVLLGLIGMIIAVPVAASIQVAILAVVPKLRKEIDLSAPPDSKPDTVESLQQETKEQHQELDATEELHRTVAEAVENIEEELLDEERLPKLEE
jgi:predicted PurR-regulated permease PerM